MDEDKDGNEYKKDGEDVEDKDGDRNLCVKDVGPPLHLPVVLHLRQNLWQRLRAIHPCVTSCFWFEQTEIRNENSL